MTDPGAVLVTRGVPEPVRAHLAGRCQLEVWDGDGVMPRAELLDRVAGKAGVVAMLTDGSTRCWDRAARASGGGQLAVGTTTDLDAHFQVGAGPNTPDVVTGATAT